MKTNEQLKKLFTQKLKQFLEEPLAEWADEFYDLNNRSSVPPPEYMLLLIFKEFQKRGYDVSMQITCNKNQDYYESMKLITEGEFPIDYKPISCSAISINKKGVAEFCIKSIFSNRPYGLGIFMEGVGEKNPDVSVFPIDSKTYESYITREDFESEVNLILRVPMIWSPEHIKTTMKGKQEELAALFDEHQM